MMILSNMTLADFFKNLSLSGWTSLLVIFATLVEIAPIKINPIGWLGERLNANMYQRVDKIESKLDEHIAESYRNNIFTTQDRLLKGEKLPMEEWKKAIKNCEKYEKHIEENKLSNGEAIEAIAYIHRKYQKALDNDDFLAIPRN